MPLWQYSLIGWKFEVVVELINWLYLFFIIPLHFPLWLYIPIIKHYRNYPPPPIYSSPENNHLFWAPLFLQDIIRIFCNFTRKRDFLITTSIKIFIIINGNIEMFSEIYIYIYIKSDDKRLFLNFNQYILSKPFTSDLAKTIQYQRT